jgi:hypothetical protein
MRRILFRAAATPSSIGGFECPTQGPRQRSRRFFDGFTQNRWRWPNHLLSLAMTCDASCRELG